MVKTNVFSQRKCGYFWCCAGVSLMIVSVGLSIAIAKTDGLILSDSNKQLVLSKKAKTLVNNAEEIEIIIDSLLPKIRGKKEKLEAQEIKKKATETKEEIEAVVEGQQEEEK